MRAVILAAGYATRMYPLTEHQPKPLLPVGRRVVLDWTMEELQRLPGLTDIALVSNAKFAAQFDAWIAKRKQSWPVPVRLLNDGSTTDERRLGAIRDLLLTIEQAGATEPLLVTAGDHITDWDLRALCAFGELRAPAASVAAYRLPDIREASRFGVIEVDRDARIVHCEEKPQQPRSDLAMICLYYLPPDVFPRLQEYLATGQNADVPGHFIVWLSRQEPVYGWPTGGKYFDIGTLETYHATCAALASQVSTTRTTRTTRGGAG